MKPFYCPHCKSFKGRFGVTMCDDLDTHRYCRSCGTRCYDTSIVLEVLVERTIKGMERVRIEKEDAETAPTVDAVPVIRCRNCKWFGKVGCAIMIADDYDKPTEDDYCSFA